MKERQEDLLAVQFHATRLGTEALYDYLRAFSAEILLISTGIHEMPRTYHSQLPHLPKMVKQLDRHLFGNQSQCAMEKEWQDHCVKSVFRKTDKTKATADDKVIPLMLVSYYKIDGDGYLSQVKARPVVRRDLQTPLDNTYAATLAIRNFGALVAIASASNESNLGSFDAMSKFVR